MSRISSLQVVLTFAILVLSTSPSAASPSAQEVILSQKIRRVTIEKSPLSSVVFFLRSKATESLRRTFPDDESSPVMIFELSFAPAENDSRSKLNKMITYQAKNVTLEDAMKECLGQVGLDFRFITKNRIEIIEKKSEHASD